jgi:hypothetical protein
MGFIVFFLDRGKRKSKERSQKRLERWIIEQEIQRSEAYESEIEELDNEADRLADRLEEHMTDKRKRDYEIRLLKESLEKRITYPRGVPPGPSREELREQREREAEKKRKDTEFQLKRKQEFENQPFQLYLKDLKANLARDPQFYSRKPAPAYMRREFLTSGEKKALDAARVVWPKRFGVQLPEIMTDSECRKAVAIGRNILYPS